MRTRGRGRGLLRRAADGPRPCPGAPLGRYAYAPPLPLTRTIRRWLCKPFRRNILKRTSTASPSMLPARAPAARARAYAAVLTGRRTPRGSRPFPKWPPQAGGGTRGSGRLRCVGSRRVGNQASLHASAAVGSASPLTKRATTLRRDHVGPSAGPTPRARRVTARAKTRTRPAHPTSSWAGAEKMAGRAMRGRTVRSSGTGSLRGSVLSGNVRLGL